MPPSLPAEMRTESQEESLEGRVDCENSMHVRIEKEHIMCAYISVYIIIYIYNYMYYVLIIDIYNYICTLLIHRMCQCRMCR